MWAQLEFILITEGALEVKLQQCRFHSQRQGISSVSRICNSISHWLQATPEEMLPPKQHSFYKPKVMLSQCGQLWAPSSQQSQRLRDWSTGPIKQIWAGNQQHLYTDSNNNVFYQLHHICYLYWFSHLLKSISIFHTYCCSKLYTPFCFWTD